LERLHVAEEVAARYTPPGALRSRWQVREGVQHTLPGQPTVHYVERHDESAEVYSDDEPERRERAQAVAEALNKIEDELS
jgi:hypothetical protein